MTNPNSLLTKIRRVLADKIDPMPDFGEGWCIDCSLSEGKTVVFSEDGVKAHMSKHDSEERLAIKLSHYSIRPA